MSWPSRGVGQRSRVARRGLVFRAPDARQGSIGQYRQCNGPFRLEPGAKAGGRYFRGAAATVPAQGPLGRRGSLPGPRESRKRPARWRSAARCCAELASVPKDHGSHLNWRRWVTASHLAIVRACKPAREGACHGHTSKDYDGQGGDNQTSWISGCLRISGQPWRQRIKSHLRTRITPASSSISRSRTSTELA